VLDGRYDKIQRMDTKHGAGREIGRYNLRIAEDTPESISWEPQLVDPREVSGFTMVMFMLSFFFCLN
jgi:hypothetical protein